jgi:hypothetical protein
MFLSILLSSCLPLCLSLPLSLSLFFLSLKMMTVGICRRKREARCSESDDNGMSTYLIFLYKYLFIKKVSFYLAKKEAEIILCNDVYCSILYNIYSTFKYCIRKLNTKLMLFNRKL